MDITFDPKYDIAYIRLRDKAAGLRTVEIGGEVNVDVSPDGRVFGIELLNAGEQLAGGRRISFRDESAGRTIEMPLAF